MLLNINGKFTKSWWPPRNHVMTMTNADEIRNSYYSILGSNIEKVIHMNVSVEVHSAYTSNQTVADESLDKCISHCGINVDCVGAMFNHTNSTCIRYFDDVNSEFSRKHQFHLQATSEEITFYYKTLNRGIN